MEKNPSASRHERCATPVSQLRGRLIAHLGLYGWSLSFRFLNSCNSYPQVSSLQTFLEIVWQNASDSAAGKEKESQLSHALYIFSSAQKEKLPHFFFLLYLSLLKAPRQLKDIDVESEYPESMWKTILSEDQSENLYFSELCAFSWITTSDLMYCLIITKNITWCRMHCVSFDYASRGRHGIQRKNKGRMMAVYWLINLHLSTVNLSPLCCQSCTPTAVIAGIWKSQLWDPFVHSRICTAFMGLLLQWL